MASAKEHFPWPASPPPSIFSFSLPRHVHRTPPRGQRERTTNARHAGEGKHLQVNASAAATPTPHRPVRFSTWEIKVLLGTKSGSNNTTPSFPRPGPAWENLAWPGCFGRSGGAIASRFRTGPGRSCSCTNRSIIIIPIASP